MLKTEAYRQFLLKKLRAGKFKAEDVKPLFCKKFNLGESSFFKYWRQAKKEYELYLEESKAKARDAATDAEAELEKLDLVDKAERMKIASDIARSISHKAADRMKALDYLSKIHGDYAPIKQDHTSKGKKINATPTTILITSSPEDTASDSED